MSKPIHDLFYEVPVGADVRHLGPISVCPCGCDTWHVVARFEDGLPVFFFTEVVCAHCGSLAYIQTPADIELDRDIERMQKGEL